jgi:hypothetical protein
VGEYVRVVIVVASLAEGLQRHAGPNHPAVRPVKGPGRAHIGSTCTQQKVRMSHGTVPVRLPRCRSTEVPFKFARAKRQAGFMETRAFLRTPDRSKRFEISKFWGFHGRLLAVQVRGKRVCVAGGAQCRACDYAPTLQASTAPLYMYCNGENTGGVVLRPSRAHAPVCTGDHLVIASTRRDG